MYFDLMRRARVAAARPVFTLEICLIDSPGRLNIRQLGVTEGGGITRAVRESVPTVDN